MTESNGKCFNENGRGTVLKGYMETTMSEKGDWDHNMQGYAVQCTLVYVCRLKVVQGLGFQLYHWSGMLLVDKWEFK